MRMDREDFKWLKEVAAGNCKDILLSAGRALRILNELDARARQIVGDELWERGPLSHWHEELK